MFRINQLKIVALPVFTVVDMRVCIAVCALALLPLILAGYVFDAHRVAQFDRYTCEVILIGPLFLQPNRTEHTR
jgi:hypothetical protein